MYPVVLCILDIPDSFSHLAHGFDANNAFQSKIGLKRKPSSKVVGGDCNTFRDHHCFPKEEAYVGSVVRGQSQPSS